MAKNLDRNSIGFEINADYIPVIKEKLQVHQKDLIGTSYEFIKQEKQVIDFKGEIHNLPYIYKDPHSLDKKIDVKKLQFGSRIDNNSPAKRKELYSVKEVLSPEKLRLNNDLIIKLIGVKEIAAIKIKAKEFILQKTKGQKVFLKFDKTKYDSENNLLCYLYLENKTFINAHLIKNGLTDVDSSMDFEYKGKFIKLLKERTAV